MAVGAELATKTLSRLAVGLAFEASRVPAFVAVSKLVEDMIDALLPDRTGKVGRCVSVDNFLSALFDAMKIGHIAPAVLPFDTAYVAELSAAFAAAFG